MTPFALVERRGEDIENQQLATSLTPRPTLADSQVGGLSGLNGSAESLDRVTHLRSGRAGGLGEKTVADELGGKVDDDLPERVVPGEDELGELDVMLRNVEQPSSDERDRDRSLELSLWEDKEAKRAGRGQQNSLERAREGGIRLTLSSANTSHWATSFCTFGNTSHSRWRTMTKTSRLRGESLL